MDADLRGRARRGELTQRDRCRAGRHDWTVLVSLERPLDFYTVLSLGIPPFVSLLRGAICESCLGITRRVPEETPTTRMRTVGTIEELRAGPLYERHPDLMDNPCWQHNLRPAVTGYLLQNVLPPG